MDPNACFWRFILALRYRDLDAADEARDDLIVWMSRGGVAPRAFRDERVSAAFLRATGYAEMRVLDLAGVVDAALGDGALFPEIERCTCGRDDTIVCDTHAPHAEIRAVARRAQVPR